MTGRVMSKYWSKLVHELSPYVPGEQPGGSKLVKLNTNENPFPPSPKVLDALRKAMGDRLRLYPEPTSRGVRETVAGYYGVKPEQVFAGNGSDEVLAHVFNALFRHDKPVLFPDITYSFYPVYCRFYGIEGRQVPLNENFRVNVVDYRQANGGIILPNPNAPTGVLLGLDQVETLLKDNPDSVVVIDEAYIDFGGDTAIPLVDRHPNLLVIQTLSKSRSLAGLRVGFAVGHEDLIEGLVRVKDSFNSYPLGMAAQVGAVAAMEDEEYFRQTCQQVMANRDELVAGLQQRGFEVLPSAANFVLTRCPAKPAAELMSELRKREVIVRHFQLPRIDQYLRITVGNEEQQTALFAALDEIL
jgi:histidinol-phosphate aminotransferase